MQTFKSFFGLGVFVLAVYLTWELLPPFFHNYQFQDYVQQAAKECTYAYNKTEDQVRTDVFKEAREDSIPITADQIQISKSGTSCSIGLNYTVHVDLPFFPQDFHFTASSANTSILQK